ALLPLSLTRELILGSRRHGAGRTRRLRSNRPGNVPFPWRNRGGQADHSDDDENDRICIAERKIAAAHLVKEKEYADGNDDSRTHQPANRTLPACATDTVTHRKKPPKNGGPAGCASSKSPRRSKVAARKTAKSGTTETNQTYSARGILRAQSK